MQSRLIQSFMMAAVALTLGCQEAGRQEAANVATARQAAARQASAEPAARTSAPEDNSSRRFLRLDRGTVLRAAPADDAEAVQITTADGPLPIADAEPPWFAVETDAGHGWLRLRPQEATERMVHIRRGTEDPKAGPAIDPIARSVAIRVMGDAVGETATEAGFLPIDGIAGSEGQTRRLLGAISEDRAPDTEHLVSQPDSDFDRGTVSFDYETSALLIRYLLSDTLLAPRLRRFLRDVADGAPASPEHLRSQLGVAWGELDRRLADWLQRSLR